MVAPNLDAVARRGAGAIRRDFGVAPAIPAMAIDLNADSNIAQLVLSVLLISIALGNWSRGLSDRFGRRPLFLEVPSRIAWPGLALRSQTPWRGSSFLG